MRKILALLLCTGFANLVTAQQKTVLHYRYFESNGLPGGIEVRQYYANKNSIELPVIKKDFKGDTVVNGLETDIRIIEKVDPKTIPFVLKNLISKSIILGERIGKSPKLVTDTLDNFKWKILNETKEINNEHCTKAETYFRGRNYVAWFKPDTLIKTGPWKFSGLPGIIFEVADIENKFVYKLENIDKVDQFPVELTVPEGYTKKDTITHSAFILQWKIYKQIAEKDNDAVTYTLTGTATKKYFVAPIPELY